MRQNGFTFKATECKHVQVIEYNDQRYVSFTYQQLDKPYCTYINMNDPEWQEFLEMLHELDQLIPRLTVVACPGCKGAKVVTQVVDGKMTTSLLDEDERRQVEENNAVAYNQQMFRCAYCGAYSLQPDDVCHCHQHDCRSCEPDNFCTTCGEITIFAV